MKTLHATTLFITALGASHAYASDATVVLEDMANADSKFDSNHFVFGDNNELGSFDATINNALDGNPDDSLEIVHLYGEVASPDADPNGYTIQSFHLYDNFWDPDVQGAVANVSFSIDINTDDGFGDVYFVVGQGGFGNFAGFQSFSSGNGYETFTATLDQSDLSSVDLTTGGQLQFGFGVLSHAPGSNSDFFEPAEYHFFADNFVVNLDLVPEPGSLALLGLGGLALLRRRR